MNLVVLTAGRATRLGSDAPHGCKAETPLDGRPIISRQIQAADPDTVTIVCRSEHQSLMRRWGTVITHDGYDGPARALCAAIHHIDTPIVVAYADTFFTDLPDGQDWCGVHDAPGGRYWDVADDDVIYRYVRPDRTVSACVGLYRFDDHDRLTAALIRACAVPHHEVGMSGVVNRYRCRFVDVPSWQDIGDRDALARFVSPSRAKHIGVV